VILSGEGVLDVVVFLGVADGLFDFLEWHAVFGPQGADGEGFDELGEADALAVVIQNSAAAHWFDGFRSEEPAVQRGLRHRGIACRLGDGVSAESFDGGLERGDHGVRGELLDEKGWAANGNPGGLGEVGRGCLLGGASTEPRDPGLCRRGWLAGLGRRGRSLVGWREYGASRSRALSERLVGRGELRVAGA